MMERQVLVLSIGERRNPSGVGFEIGIVVQEVGEGGEPFLLTYDKGQEPPLKVGDVTTLKAIPSKEGG
jgi:hypothetical protein